MSKQEGIYKFSENGSSSEWFKDDIRTSSSLDIKRFLYNVQRYWYFVVLSVLLFVTAAYLINRYTTRIYPVKASIIIKGDNERIGAEFLYSNPLLTSYKNYDNELFLIKSYPLLQRVIEELNFTTSFYKEGNIKTSELYSHVPIEVHSFSGLPYGSTYIFKLVSNYQFKIRETESNGFDDRVYSLNDTVAIGEWKLFFKLKPQNSISKYINEELLLVFNDPLMLARSYENELKVYWADEGASVVNLEISGTSPEKEIDFLNGLIEYYLKFDLEKKSTAATLSLQFIDDQLKIIQDSLQYFEAQLEHFKNINTSSDIGAENVRLFQKLEEMDRQSAELAIRQDYFAYLVDYVRKDTGLDQIVLPNTVGIADPILNNLIEGIVKLQISLKLFEGRESNPLVQDSKDRLSALRTSVIESVNNVKQTDKIRSDFINRQTNLLEKQLAYLPTAERELVTIKRNYSLSESLYLFLMQKRAEAGINKASTIPDISIVNPPQQIGGPIAPKGSRNLIIGLFLGLIVPLGIFFIAEYLNNKIQSKDDIDRITTIPFIGAIGHKNVAHNLIAFSNSKSSITEAFRALRSNLAFFTEGKKQKVFMVTSSLSGEGKTFTTINLASILAMSGKKTVIVGADMRRPKIFDDFSLSNDIGLSSYLSLNATPESIIQKTSWDNLFLVSGGPIPPNPSELLLKPTMQEFVEYLLERFDYIIIDTPPVGLVTDAFVLSKVADHTIFVVRQNYTPKDLLHNINDYYQSGRITKLSILLNDVHRAGAGYGYGYAYGYGYGYYGYGYGAKEYYEETTDKLSK